MRDLGRRTVSEWRADCWFGFVIEALPEAVRRNGQQVVHTPAHFLVAAWEPVSCPPLPQLPTAAAIVSNSAGRAVSELLRLIPPAVPIRMLERDRVNIGLIAEMILVADRHLDAGYRQDLRQFIAGERLAWQATIRAGYADRDPSFERFKARLLGGGPA